MSSRPVRAKACRAPTRARVRQRSHAGVEFWGESSEFGLMNAPDRPLSVSYADVAAAAEQLAGHAHRTPALTSRTIDERTGAQVFFKCENFQRMGAFKFRGAYNAMSRLAPDERERGVLAYSSGNHAQAVALAGKLLGVRVTIVMPADAPAGELRAAPREWGAGVVFYKDQEGGEEGAQRGARRS